MIGKRTSAFATATRLPTSCSVAQEAPPAAGWEVAERAPEERDEPRADRRGEVRQVAFEVADDGVYLRMSTQPRLTVAT